jgi:hypothetical protein
MRDARHGIVLGTASSLYPSGVWTTNDGGRTFSPLLGSSNGGWSTGDGSGPQLLALAGHGGQIGFVRQGRLGSSNVSPFGLRNPSCLRLNDDGVGILVGDGGLVRATVNGGQQWHALPQAVPERHAKHFDFSAAAVAARQAWIAGSPGTCVFHTSDGGQTWQARPTKQPLPIHALCFVDERHGWAVGALGTILASEDSGHTWHRQRGGGARVAALGVFGSDRAVPWAALARLSASQGYLTAVDIIGRTDEQRSPVAEASWQDRVHEALVLAGASATSTYWRFPVHEEHLALSPDRIVDRWNRAGDDDAVAHAEDRLVRAIRQWRPDVLLTHGATQAEEGDPLGWIVHQLVLSAVRRAADPEYASEQQIATGLQPWRVRRVFGTVDDAAEADLVLPATELAPRLGRSLGEQATAARSLTEAVAIAADTTLAFRRLTGVGPGPSPDLDVRSGSDFFDGIFLQRGGAARRGQGPLPAAGLAAVRKQVQLRRNLEQILSSALENDRNSAARLGQIAYLVRELDPDGAANLLHQLATRQAHCGHPEQAVETFSWLVNRYGDHALAESALIWLVGYYASGETQWQMARKSQLLVRQASAAASVPSRLQFVTPVGQTWQPETGNPTGGQLPTGGTATADHAIASLDDTYDSARKAIQFAGLIRSTRPSLAAEPAVGLPEAVAQRRLHRLSEAKAIYRRIVSDRREDAWWSCARAELGGTRQKGGPPKPVAHGVRTDTRPVLDGKLDDRVWAIAQMIELVSSPHPRRAAAAARSSPPGSESSTAIPGALTPQEAMEKRSASHSRHRERWPATVLLARDEEFLYLAVDCQRTAPMIAEPPAGPRPRDPDLSDQDRVDLLIDVDRDYATYYRFTVDHRGFTGEACFGDKTWDPKWFVAAAPGQTTWTVEAAIPLQELTPESPGRGDAWAVGLQRTIPGVGFQSWSQPASPVVKPQGFGLLLFE